MEGLIQVLQKSQVELNWFALSDAVRLSSLCAHVIKKPKKGNKKQVIEVGKRVARFLQGQSTDRARSMARQVWAELDKL